MVNAVALASAVNDKYTYNYTIPIIVHQLCYPLTPNYTITAPLSVVNSVNRAYVAVRVAFPQNNYYYNAVAGK